MSICTFNLSTSLDLFRFWGLATRRRSVISPRVNFPCRVTDPVLSDWWIRTFTHIYAETCIIHVIHTLFLAGIKNNCPHNLSTRFYAWNLLNFWRFTEAVLDIQMFNSLPWCNLSDLEATRWIVAVHQCIHYGFETGKWTPFFRGIQMDVGIISYDGRDGRFPEELNCLMKQM